MLIQDTTCMKTVCGVRYKQHISIIVNKDNERDHRTRRINQNILKDN